MNKIWSKFLTTCIAYNCMWNYFTFKIIDRSQDISKDIKKWKFVWKWLSGSGEEVKNVKSLQQQANFDLKKRTRAFDLGDQKKNCCPLYPFWNADLSWLHTWSSSLADLLILINHLADLISDYKTYPEIPGHPIKLHLVNNIKQYDWSVLLTLYLCLQRILAWIT